MPLLQAGSVLAAASATSNVVRNEKEESVAPAVLQSSSSTFHWPDLPEGNWQECLGNVVFEF